MKVRLVDMIDRRLLLKQNASFIRLVDNSIVVVGMGVMVGVGDRLRTFINLRVKYFSERHLPTRLFQFQYISREVIFEKFGIWNIWNIRRHKVNIFKLNNLWGWEVGGYVGVRVGWREGLWGKGS